MVALGLFVDLRMVGHGGGPGDAGDVAAPSPGGRTFALHTARTIELLVEAERLGADAAWFTEHHLFADGYLAQPLVLAAAVATRTSRLRLGTAVLLAPLRHPRHIAEEAAMVDLIAGGRLELGLGAGYAAREFEAFGADPASRFEATESSAAEVLGLFASGEVTPGPVQDPLPVWLGFQGPVGARRAGRLGTGLLSLDPALLAPYREGLAEGGHRSEAARMAGLVEVVVADDPERAAERILPYWLHQQNSYRAIMRRPDGRPPSPLRADRARETLQRTGRLGGLAVVDVDGAVALLRQHLDGVPARHAFAWLSVGGMPDDLVERHLELWCGPVRDTLAADRLG